MERARKALPADRATLTLARCALILGDPAQAEKLVEKAIKDEGHSEDPAALQLAATIAVVRNKRVEANGYLNTLKGLTGASAADKAWVNRTRALMFLATNRQPDRDDALGLLDRNLAEDPESIEDLSLKASILAARPAHRAEAIVILERLSGAGRLSDDQRFLLAQLYLGQAQEPKYRGEMLKLLDRKVKDPRHLAHYVNHLIDQKQLDQADRWLAELMKVDPKGLPALELEARLLDLRNAGPSCWRVLQARGKDMPDDIGFVADRLSQYGYVKEAEAAYKSYVAREPKQPQRVLALAQFFALRNRLNEAVELFKTAWSTCRHDQVAAAALSLYDAKSVTEDQRRQVDAWLTAAIRDRPGSRGS